jgi:hypothetical protein
MECDDISAVCISDCQLGKREVEQVVGVAVAEQLAVEDEDGATQQPQGDAEQQAQQQQQGDAEQQVVNAEKQQQQQEQQQESQQAKLEEAQQAKQEDEVQQAKQQGEAQQAKQEGEAARAAEGQEGPPAEPMAVDDALWVLKVRLGFGFWLLCLPWLSLASMLCALWQSDLQPSTLVLMHNPNALQQSGTEEGISGSKHTCQPK